MIIIFSEMVAMYQIRLSVLEGPVHEQCKTILEKILNLKNWS